MGLVSPPTSSLLLLLLLCLYSSVGELTNHTNVSPGDISSTSTLPTSTLPTTTTTRKPKLKRPTNWKPPTYWRIEDVPDPLTDVWKCGNNGKPSHVCDPNGVGGAETSRINAAVRSLIRASKSHCPCGGRCSPGYRGYRVRVFFLAGVEGSQRVSSYYNTQQLTFKSGKKIAERFDDSLCGDSIVITLIKGLGRDDDIGRAAQKALEGECINRDWRSPHSEITAWLNDYTKVLRGKGTGCPWGWFWMVAGIIVLILAVLGGLYCLCQVCKCHRCCDFNRQQGATTYNSVKMQDIT